MADTFQANCTLPLHSNFLTTPTSRLNDEIRKHRMPIRPQVTLTKIRPAIVQSQSWRHAKSDEDMIIAQALAILGRRLNKEKISISSPELVESYLLHKLAMEEREIFGVLWLDVKNRLIAAEDIALGSLSRTTIYPREIVKSALKHNAAGVIFYHNHPTGDANASPADKVMTLEMKQLLHVFDVRLLDHVIVSGTKTNSFAKGGML